MLAAFCFVVEQVLHEYWGLGWCQESSSIQHPTSHPQGSDSNSADPIQLVPDWRWHCGIAFVGQHVASKHLTAGTATTLQKVFKNSSCLYMFLYLYLSHVRYLLHIVNN
jgi:hypothetical protein